VRHVATVADQKVEFERLRRLEAERERDIWRQIAESRLAEIRALQAQAAKPGTVVPNLP
jgi:hypothetical protein